MSRPGVVLQKETNRDGDMGGGVGQSNWLGMDGGGYAAGQVICFSWKYLTAGLRYLILLYQGGGAVGVLSCPVCTI